MSACRLDGRAVHRTPAGGGDHCAAHNTGRWRVGHLECAFEPRAWRASSDAHRRSIADRHAHRTADGQSLATPTALPTVMPTAPPVVIRFAASPTTASWQKCLNGTPPPSQALTLDNSQSTVAVSWQASAVETVDTGKLWAVITPASGTVPAHSKRAITVSPDPTSPIDVCASSSASGTPWHVKIVAAHVGTYTCTYTVY